MNPHPPSSAPGRRTLRQTLRTRARVLFAVVSTAVVLVTSLPMAAVADPIVPRLSGTVTLDTNADGTIGTETAHGADESGLPGVQIDVVCVATDAAILTAISDVDGAWEFDDVDLGEGQLGCPDGVVRVRSTVTDDRYSIADAPGLNQTPRTSDAQIGLSEPLTLTDTSDVTVNTLARPDWYLDLTIPIDATTGGEAVFTGSDPFDTGCPQVGKDCAADDLKVRSADTVTFTWAVTGSSLDDLATSLDAVVLEQTLALSDGAIANFARIPARCKPAGGGGAAPTSVIVDQDGTVIPEGEMPPAGTTSVTLRCNLGTWSQTGDAVTLQPVVKVSAESPSGATFTSTARAYAVEDVDGRPSAVPAAGQGFGPVDITSAPAFELEKKGFFGQSASVLDIGRGPEPGWITDAIVQIKTNRKVGVEALQQPITISEDIFGFGSDGTTPYPDLEFAIVDCAPNPSHWGGTVGGRAAPYGEFTSVTEDSTVIDSGSCAVARDDSADYSSDYTLTFSGIDMSGVSYPTRTAGGADLSAGPFYVASYRVRVFLPYDTLDAANGVLGDESGGLTLFNRVGGFDPDGVSGSSNFGDGVEPGYCDTESIDDLPASDPGRPRCDPSSTNTVTPGKSDNLIGPTSMVMSPGYFAKYLLDQTAMYSSAWKALPNMNAAHDGQAVLQPEQIADTHMNWTNSGQETWHNSELCDVFDNTTAKLVPSSATVANGKDSTYAWLSASGPGTGNDDPTAEALYNAKWIFEFAHIDLSGDDPLAGGLNRTTARYDGDWDAQSSARCEDDTPTGGWFTDPNSVPGGLDEVNAVRVRPGIDPETGQRATHDFSVNNRLNFGMQIRDEFFSGPHSGESIPAGTVFANFGSARADESGDGSWVSRNYKPSPETTAVDGDRVTISRASLALQKRTITVGGIGDGAADFGNTGAAVAGNPIVWEVAASVQADSIAPAPVQHLTISDVLPAFAEYDADCTAALEGGTPADVVEYNTPSVGSTTLTWNLGEWLPNTQVPNRRICTNSDPLAPNGTSLTNRAEVTYTGSPVQPFDTHTVILEQTGEIKLRKSVDAPLDVLNDGQDYTLSMQNFSETLTVGAPTFIEVFPYNGDANPLGGVNRSPSSAFRGALALVDEPKAADIGGSAYDGVFFYTTDDPATVDQDLNDNTSTWVTATELDGDFAAVTAIKFIGNTNLTPVTAKDTSGLTVAFTLQAGDSADPFSSDANAAGDLYSDRFTAFSSTFTGAEGFQMLASNRTTVRTVSHSDGDLVFEDRDGDGAFTAGRDALVPDGAVVDLYYEGRTGDRLVQSTTTSGGAYLFTKLPPGTYHVEIAAAQFRAGGPLDGYSLTVAPSAGPGEEKVNQNDDESHDAISGANGSIVSHSFTLSATVDPSTKSVTGDEVSGDDIHGVNDSTTTDTFSNLSIDLALQRASAIDIEKEVCTLADNSCDPAAGLGSGGWSVDGIDGIGPIDEVTARPYGAAVLWRITVTNTGEQYLTDVAVTDAVTVDCAATDADVPAFHDFAPGSVEMYTCQTPSITADISPNTADVVGTPEHSSTVVRDIDTASATTAGSVVINKIITGPGRENYGTGPFEFDVVCTLGSAAVLRTSVMLTPIAGAGSVTSDPIPGIPLGSSCTVTETNSGGADQTPVPVTIEIVANDDENTVIVELTNTFSRGRINVVKALMGTAAKIGYVTDAEFDVLVTCQVDSTDEEGTGILSTVYSGTVSLRGGETVDVLGDGGAPVLLPIGARCFGEETDDAGASSSSVDFDSYDNAAVVGQSDDEQQLTITATNVFDLSKITVEKIVTGGGAPGPYSFQLSCTVNGGAPYALASDDASFTLWNGESRVVDVLVGTECAVVEKGAPPSAIVTIADTDGNTTGGTSDGVVVAAPDGHRVTITNRYVGLAATGLATDPRLAVGIGGGLLVLGAACVLVAVRRRRARTRGM